MYCDVWRQEEAKRKMTGLQKSVEVLHGMMNNVYNFLIMTMESQDDFGDGTLPTLDLRVWVREDNKVMYSFYEKPMSSNQVIQKASAMPENMRMSTLNQEVTRRMLNTCEWLDDRVRWGILDDFCQKLCNSGYGLDQTRRIVVGGLTGYERKLALMGQVQEQHQGVGHRQGGHRKDQEHQEHGRTGLAKRLTPKSKPLHPMCTLSIPLDYGGLIPRSPGGLIPRIIGYG